MAERPEWLSGEEEAVGPHLPVFTPDGIVLVPVPEEPSQEEQLDA